MTLFVNNTGQPRSMPLVKKNVRHLIDRSTKTDDTETANYQKATRKRILCAEIGGSCTWSEAGTCKAATCLGARKEWKRCQARQPPDYNVDTDFTSCQAGMVPADEGCQCEQCHQRWLPFTLDRTTGCAVQTARTRPTCPCCRLCST
jgi:hypothetical protein